MLSGKPIMESPDHAHCNVLVVDGDDLLRARLTRAFAERGLVAAGAANPGEAVRFARSDPPEMVVVEPGGSKLQFITELRELAPAIRVVVLTAYGSIASAIDAIRLGATHYLAKPAEVDEILAAFGKGQGTAASHDNDSYEPQSLARTEWEHIHRVLADCGGNISRAARRLKIHRRSLQRKLRRFAPPA